MGFLNGFLKGNELNLYQEKNCLNIKRTFFHMRGTYKNYPPTVWLASIAGNL